MKIVAIFTALLLAVATLSRTSDAAFCNYYRNSNRVTCGRVTCSAASPPWWSMRLPRGYYRLGVSDSRSNWFDLYPRRSNGQYWDYHTKVPEYGCEGGFALHGGSFSRGCVTVTDWTCFNRLSREITSRYSGRQFTARECLRCFFGQCRGGLGTVRRSYITDLQSI